MNFCSKCGNKLNNENKCIECDASVESNNDEIRNKRKNIISKILAVISIVLASVPLLLIIYIFIEGKTSSDTTGLIAPILVYYYFALVPNAIGSLVCGLISNKINKNKLVTIGFILNILPLIGSIFYISMLIFGFVINLFS